jgi:hypothetical protein
LNIQEKGLLYCTVPIFSGVASESGNMLFVSIPFKLDKVVLVQATKADIGV